MVYDGSTPSVAVGKTRIIPSSSEPSGDGVMFLRKDTGD